MSSPGGVLSGAGLDTVAAVTGLGHPAALGAGLCAGLAAALWCRPDPAALARSRLHGPAADPVPDGPAERSPARAAAVAWRAWRRASRGRRWLHVPVVVGAGLLAVLGPAGMLLAAAGALVAGGAAWLHARGRRRRRAERGRRDTIEACDALVAELRAGQPAPAALARAAEHHPRLRPAARACALGGDVPPVLRRLATSPGSSGLSTLAAAWQVAERSGSGLVAVLERVAAGLRTDDAVRAEVEASLAPARATARLLAVLPVFGLLLGSGLGGDPVGLLLGSPVGNGLLLAGVTLALGGTVWVERLAARAER